VSNSALSIILPVWNEERNLPVLLESLASQKTSLAWEILVVDAGSTDGTGAILAEYEKRLPIRVLDNPRRDCHFAKKTALEVAAHDLICFLDADNEIHSEHWLETSVGTFRSAEEKFHPLVLESRYLPSPRDSALCNHLTADLHVGDPLVFHVAPKLKMVCQNSAYSVAIMPPGWPTGANGFFFRKSLLQAHPIAREWFAESDYFSRVAASETLYLLRVHGVGVMHHYVRGWASYFRKRMKIGRKFFTRRAGGDDGSWVEQGGMMKNLLWSLYLLSFAPPFVESLARAVRRRNARWLLHAPAGWISVAAYAAAFVQIRVLKQRAFP
jgi:glycosyltransferase involved in cell wall biosynthesis